MDHMRCTIAHGIVEQRDLRFVPHASIAEALAHCAEALTDGNTVAPIVLRKGGELYELNCIGALIWDELTRDASMPHIVATISGLFNESASVIEKDVRNYIAELADNGFINLH